MVKELASYLGEVTDMVFVDYSGLSAPEVDAFRAQLASGASAMRVVKNSITRLAFKELGREVTESLIDGPVAILHGEDIVAVAKAAVEFGRKNRTLKMRGAFVEGEVLSAAEVGALTKLPSRPELLSQISGQVLAPAANVSGAAGAPAALIASCLKQRIEDLEKDAA